MNISFERRSEYINQIKDISAQEGQEKALFESILQFCIEFQDEYSETERTLFGDILVKIVGRLEISDRAAAAEKLAKIRRAPLKVVRYLALQPIEVARPILVFSQVLTDHDLMIVIRIRAFDHMSAIASRETVSLMVSAELIRLGNENVYSVLLANQGATISARAYQRLVKAAPSDLNLHVTVLSRDDLPLEIGRLVVETAGEPIRKYLIERGRGDLLIYLDQNNMARIEGLASALPDDMPDLARIYEAMADQNKRKAFTEVDLVDALEKDDKMRTIAIFSFLSGLNLKNTINWLTRRDVDPAIMACKAIGFKRETVEMLLRKVIHNGLLAPGSQKKFLKSFDDLKPEVAKKVYKMRVKALH